jgi:hypothetical protein
MTGGHLRWVAPPRQGTPPAGRWRGGPANAGPGRSGGSSADRRAGSVLDVAQRHAGIQGQRHHRVAQAVRTDRLAQAGPAGEPAHDSGRLVAVPAGGRPRTAAARRCARPARHRLRERFWGQGQHHPCAALADHRKHPVARSIPRSATSTAHASETRSPFSMSRQAKVWSRAELVLGAARNRAASSRSSPSACESRATEGRRTWATGSGGVPPPRRCSGRAPAKAASRRATVERARPARSRPRARASTCARSTASSSTPTAAHHSAKPRRSAR